MAIQGQQTKSMEKIISWNIQGMNTSKQNLSILLKEENPVVISLQETMCNNKYEPKISGYQIIHKRRSTVTRAAGGVLIGINNDFSFQEIDITNSEKVEAIAVHIESPLNINIINMYIPPNKKIEKKDIQEVIDQKMSEENRDQSS